MRIFLGGPPLLRNSTPYSPDGNCGFQSVGGQFPKYDHGHFPVSAVADNRSIVRKFGA